MQRIIINTSSPIMDVYSVSDDYLRKCFEQKNTVDTETVKYLEESDHFCILLDTALDIFEGNTISDFRTLRTDGYWIWSADLNDYYEKFGFIWPQEFVDFSKANSNSNVSDSLLDHTLEQYWETIHFLQNGVKTQDETICPVNVIELV